MTVAEIARLLAGKVQGEGRREIRGVAGLEAAGPEELTFMEGKGSVGREIQSRAGCILVPEGVALAGLTTIAVAHPKLAFIRAAEALAPRATAAPGVHPTAIVAPDARIDPNVSVGPHVVIESGATVGEGTSLGAGVYLGEGVRVGAQCVLHPRVTLYPGARVGNRVILHAGVVIGSDGFGYVFAEGRHHKFPQLGQVVIEDDVEIGSNSAVDRGSLGITVIGQGTKIDNLVQIAHNVKIGRHCVIAAQAGISGSSKIGNYVVMGGQVGVADHIRIEDQVMIGGQSGLFPGKIVRKGSQIWGTPARPIAEYKRMYAHLSHLPELAAQVRQLARNRAQQTRSESAG